jgi:hypothetical protein
MTLPATLMRDGRNYTISFDASSLGNPRDEPVRFHVSFDVFFVPKAIGINEDTRELVIPAPSRVEMHSKRL